MGNQKEVKMQWRVHTPNLLKEIAQNIGKNGTAVATPLQILAQLLSQVGERAAELNDEKLNALMVRLTIYSVADPESPDFDQDVVDKFLLV